MTHETLEANMDQAKKQLEALALVRNVASIIRIENIAAWTEGVFEN